jgi:hypothetical protein
MIYSDNKTISGLCTILSISNQQRLVMGVALSSRS